MKNRRRAQPVQTKDLPVLPQARQLPRRRLRTGNGLKKHPLTCLIQHRVIGGILKNPRLNYMKVQLGCPSGFLCIALETEMTLKKKKTGKEQNLYLLDWTVADSSQRSTGSFSQCGHSFQAVVLGCMET